MLDGCDIEDIAKMLKELYPKKTPEDGHAHHWHYNGKGGKTCCHCGQETENCGPYRPGGGKWVSYF